MKFVLCGIALAAGVWFAVQTPTGRAAMRSVQAAAGGLVSPIVGR